MLSPILKVDNYDLDQNGKQYNCTSVESTLIMENLHKTIDLSYNYHVLSLD